MPFLAPIVPFIGPALGIAGSLIGSSKSARASRDAARIQSQASAASAAEERRQFDITQQNIQPFLKEGQRAVGRLGDILLQGGDLNAPDIPGLDRAKQAGLDAVEGSAFARGQGLSGRTMASLFNQGQSFDFAASRDFLNRLSSLSGGGQTAGTNLGSLGAQSAGRVSSLLQSGGDARASGVVGANNAFQGGLTGVSKGLTDLFALPGRFGNPK